MSKISKMPKPQEFKNQAESNRDLYPPPYEIMDGCLQKWVTVGKVQVLKKLCNFLPFLVGEVIIDDGAVEKGFYKISAIHQNGKTMPEVIVPIGEFASMNWVNEKWFSVCNLESGQGIRDHIRHAIQSTAKEGCRQTVYTHLGWRKIDNCWEFLFPGMNENCVPQDLSLCHYRFEGECSEDDIVSALYLFDSGVAKNEILHPLLAVNFLAPLHEFLKQAGFEPTPLLAVIGRTGSKKSTLAALTLSFFGNFTHDTLPLTFRDTANSTLERLFLLKDVPCVIDDFHPSTRFEENEMTKTFQLILRAFGDKTARGRMKADLSLATPKPPRGIGIITAEYPPAVSESGTARYLSLEIKNGDVNISELSLRQEGAKNGKYNRAMRGYIDFIKNEFLHSDMAQRDFVKTLRTLFLENRKRFRTDLNKRIHSFHDRIPDACAFLQIGFLFVMKYFVSNNVLAQEKADEQNENFYFLLLSLAENQCHNIKEEKVTEKFIRKLFSLLSSGTVTLTQKSDPANNFGNSVGWQDEFFYYLLTDNAHKAVRRLCEEQGESFSVSARTLLSQLHDEGYLEIGGDGKRTRTLNLGGNYVRVAFVKKSKFMQTALESVERF